MCKNPLISFTLPLGNFIKTLPWPPMLRSESSLRYINLSSYFSYTENENQFQCKSHIEWSSKMYQQCILIYGWIHEDEWHFLGKSDSEIFNILLIYWKPSKLIYSLWMFLTCNKKKQIVRNYVVFPMIISKNILISFNMSKLNLKKCLSL